MKGRKGKKHEHVNHERWLVSYADFITLLFAFFVVMFAVSQVDSKKLGRFVDSVNYAFQFKGVFPENTGSLLTPGGSAGKAIIPPVVAERPTFMPYRAPSQRAALVKSALESRLELDGCAERATLGFEPRGVVISLSERVLFDSRSAVLRADATETLRSLGRALYEETAPIQVEVHTGDLASPSPLFASNWELSAARAARVVRFLIEDSDVAPARLYAAGLAEHHVVPDDATGLAGKLRGRVDLVVVTGADAE